jgi:multidrug efflux pump subunit AcrB
MLTVFKSDGKVPEPGSFPLAALGAGALFMWKWLRSGREDSYGQLIVITKSAKETPGLVKTLRSELPQVALEALVMVKKLQQGSQIESPVEVGISGDDIAVLKKLGHQVEGILRETPFATYARNDYYDDSWMVGVNVRAEEANRLGLTNASIAHSGQRPRGTETYHLGGICKSGRLLRRTIACWPLFSDNCRYGQKAAAC